MVGTHGKPITPPRHSKFLVSTPIKLIFGAEYMSSTSRTFRMAISKKELWLPPAWNPSRTSGSFQAKWCRTGENSGPLECDHRSPKTYSIGRCHWYIKSNSEGLLHQNPLLCSFNSVVDSAAGAYSLDLRIWFAIVGTAWSESWIRQATRRHRETTWQCWKTT